MSRCRVLFRCRWRFDVAIARLLHGQDFCLDATPEELNRRFWRLWSTASWRATLRPCTKCARGASTRRRLKKMRLWGCNLGKSGGRNCSVSGFGELAGPGQRARPTPTWEPLPLTAGRQRPYGKSRVFPKEPDSPHDHQASHRPDRPGVMGRSLALNLADHGFDVSLHDRSPQAVARSVADDTTGRLHGFRVAGRLRRQLGRAAQGADDGQRRRAGGRRDG